MELRRAILERRSMRAYLSDPVPEDVLKDILDIARWAPSESNTQAWNIVVVSGDAKKRLSKALVEASKIDIIGHPEIPLPSYSRVLKERSRTLGSKVLKAKGIDRKDIQGRIWWAQEMLRFFGAPVVAVIHVPRAIYPHALPDIGMIGMCIMLLATEKGLATCPTVMAVGYPEVLKELLPIPEENLAVFAISLGYPDMSDPVNRFDRERAPVSEFTTWVK
ncbi:MAG: nitroreductase [Chloroflexi bacterium]|nr:nitroreductase [Chloroflexota bacterium]